MGLSGSGSVVERKYSCPRAYARPRGGWFKAKQLNRPYVRLLLRDLAFLEQRADALEAQGLAGILGAADPIVWVELPVLRAGHSGRHDRAREDSGEQAEGAK